MRRFNKITTQYCQRVLAIILAGLVQPAFALLPPWYLLANQLKAALQADSCIHVNDLTGQDKNMEVVVNVCDYNKALALSAFIGRKHAFGENLIVQVKVMFAGQAILPISRPNNIDETIVYLKRALDGNKYFVNVFTNSYKDGVFVEFRPAVIQYFSDDFLDYYNNNNLVASEAFYQILNTDESTNSNEIRISTTTSLIRD